MTNDTPRCNALESNPLDRFDYRAWIKLARELERELYGVQAALAQAHTRLDVRGDVPRRAVWDGKITIHNDSVINGEFVKAGTVLYFNQPDNSDGSIK